MGRERITTKDINSIYDAISFIDANTDGVFIPKEVKYYNDLTRRLSKLRRFLNKKIK